MKTKPHRPKGRIFVVSAPSGAGKTTLVQKLVKGDRRLVKSISMTTRWPRPREVDGRDYYFVSDPVFQRLIQRRRLVEWARVHGHYYGTPRAALEQARSQGKDVVLVIDVQGAMQIHRRFPEAVLVFVKAPSWGELRRRLAHRSSNLPAEIRRRLAAARREMRFLPCYDYLVVNRTLPAALRKLQAILEAERCRISG